MSSNLQLAFAITRRMGCPAVVVIFLTMGACCHAAMLNLVPQGGSHTDITSSFASANYNATTHLLTVSGTATAIDYDGSAPPDSSITKGGSPGQPASFKISIHVDNSGNLMGPPTANDLNIMGIIPNGPHQSLTYGNLLLGQIQQFGFANAAPHRLLEFVFQVGGGSQQAQFGSKVGVVFDTISGFNGSFATNFSTSFTGNADNFGVPEPSAAVLGILGFSCSAVAVRRAAPPAGRFLIIAFHFIDIFICLPQL